MSENKNIDGIKKLSKEEVKKARKVLLDYIGEDEKKKPEEPKNKKKNRNMDGIMGNFNFSKNTRKADREKISEKQLISERDELKKELGIKKEKEEDTKDKVSDDALMKIAERETRKKALKQKREEQRIKELKERQAEEEKEKEEKELAKKEKEEKKKLALEAKKEKEEKEKREKELEAKTEENLKLKKHLEKVRKEEEERKKRKKEEERLAKKKKKEEEKKEKKKHRKKKRKQEIHKAYKKTLNFLKEMGHKKKKIIILFLLFFVSSVLVYLVFVLVLVKASPDNKFSRLVADYIPVPVLVSSAGVIEYYDYVDKQKEISAGFDISSQAEINKVFAFDFVLNSLIKKYAINPSEDDLRKKIETAMLYDLDVNNVGIKRIGKIKELIDDGENFVQVSNKYGDKVDKVDFSNEEEAVEAFGSKLSGLRIEEVSDIVVHDDGYYIFKRYKKNDLFSLSYVYIKSLSLDEYLNEEAQQLKIWSLVD